MWSGAVSLPISSRLSGSASSKRRYIGFAFAGIGLTVLAFLWFGDDGFGGPPLVFKVFGSFIAIVFAGKYPDRTASVVINCAAAKLGHAGRLIFRNWIDIARLDPEGPGSRTLAELIAWQAFSKEFLEAPDAEAAIDNTQRILRDSNDVEVFTAACRAMCDMDLRAWLPRITAPALVLGGSDDVMTPWDQGPDGAGQNAIHEGIAGAEKHVIAGSGHSTIFDNSQEHNRVVADFFQRHPAAAGGGA